MTPRASVRRVTTLEGRRNGLPVRVLLRQTPEYRVEHGSYGSRTRVLSHYHMTAKVAAGYKFGAGPKMKLMREGTFRSWLKQFGYQDIEVGDGSLDFQLTIKGEPEEEIKKSFLNNLGLIRMHCHERVATLPQSDGNQISADGEMSTAERVKSIEGLSTLIDFLVSLASTDLAGAESLRLLACTALSKRFSSFA